MISKTYKRIIKEDKLKSHIYYDFPYSKIKEEQFEIFSDYGKACDDNYRISELLELNEDNDPEKLNNDG